MEKTKFDTGIYLLEASNDCALKSTSDGHSDLIPSCAHTGKNWRLEPPFSKGGQGGFCEWRFYLFERNFV